MKVLADNKITSISADSENVNYPAENVLDDHPKRKFIADGDYQATLSCEVSSGIDGIAIFGTNAEAAFISISDPNEVSWGVESAWDSVNEWAYLETTPNFNIEQTGDAYSLWGSFNYINGPVDVEIILVTTSDKIINVGVVIIGEILTFRDPKYGLMEGLVDYSILEELSNGATYYKKRDIVRTFQGQLMADRDNDFYDFTAGIARANGKTPLAWRVTDINSMNWVVYARFQNMPNGTHDFLSYSTLNFSLIEVL